MIRLVVILALGFFSCTPAFSAELPKEHRDSARGMADEVKSKLGSSESITTNAFNPLTSDTKMKTFNGSKEFDAQLLCSGSNTFADFTIAPLASGNIKVINVRQDTDMDGVIDSYQTPGWEASAICANGYMYCADQGNPSTCKSYVWSARDGDFLVSPKQTAMTSLGGCYCINGACGSNLVMSNLDTVLGDISTGMAAALAEKNAFFTLTDIKTNGTYAELRGRDTSSCNPTSAESILGSEDVKSIQDADYLKNPSKLQEAGFAAQEESPLYKQLAPNINDEGFELRSCNINRVISEDKVSSQDIIAFDSGTGSLYEIDHDTLRIVLGEIGNNYWEGDCKYFPMETNFFVKRPERIKSAKILRAKWDDWMQVHIVKDNTYTHVWNGPYGNWTSPTAGVPGKCELRTEWDDDSLNVDFKPALNEEGSVKFVSRVLVGGDGEGYLLGEIELDTSCKIEKDQYTNTCSMYQENDKCTLVEENVDGVTTFKDGFSTGLFPLPRPVGDLCGVTQKRDWMKKSRTYRCESDYKYDFSAGFERMEYVKSNSELENWKDKTTDYDTGESSLGDGKFTLYDGLGAQACSMTCKTRKERPMIDLTLSGTTGSKHNAPVTYDFFYHQCTGDDSNVCPSGEGEEVIKACQCINEFSEATAIMQSLRLAGQDMICTDGTKAMPDGAAKK